MKRFWIIVGCLALVMLAASALLGDGGGDSPYREIGRTTEKELNVVLSSSFGGVTVSRGQPEKILVADANADGNEDARMSVEYSIRNRVGYMDVSLGHEPKEGERKKGGFKVGNIENKNWYLHFSDAIPISFDIQLGVGKGEFDLSGLQVKDFNLSSGACEVDLTFDQPNKSSIDNISIESGVSKFTGRNLGNANFKRLKFQGGVGAYTLDFSGALKNEVDVDVDVGVGLLTIIIPNDVGAKIFYEKSWVSRLDCARDFQSVADNEYVSGNYGSTPGKMNIRIDSGLGSVRVKRK